VSSDPHSRFPAAPTPAPLAVAASVTALEALGYAVIGITEWAATDPDKPLVALSTGLFFVVFSAFLGYCGWRLWRLSSWARAPIVMTQVIQIPVGISFWGAGWTRAVTVVMLLASGLVLAGIFHPQSLEALESAD
jgi:hypothetical protein